jgi:hypothetical protein
MEQIYFIKEGIGTEEALTYCTVGFKILCFCFGGTDKVDQTAVIVSGGERLVKKLKAVPLRVEQACRGGGGIAVPIPNLGTRKRLVANATPRLLCPRERDPIPTTSREVRII